jgi:hypothetical protein
MDDVLRPRFAIQCTLTPADSAASIDLVPSAEEPLRTRLRPVLVGGPGAKGDPGDPGSDADVTNANVNAAIAADPAATRAVLGVTSSAWGAVTGTLSDQIDLQSALDAKLDDSEVGSTIAPLTAGKVPSAYLPSYVDDVLEVANYAALPGTGETGKIYVTLDTNKEYRWSGSAYIELVASPGTTDAITEGTVNLYFTTSRVLATALAGLVFTSAAAVTSADSMVVAVGKLQAQITAQGAAQGDYLLKTLAGDTTVNANGYLLRFRQSAAHATAFFVGDVPNVSGFNDYPGFSVGYDGGADGYGVNLSLITTGGAPSDPGYGVLCAGFNTFAANGTGVAPTAVVNGQPLGFWNFMGCDGAAGTYGGANFLAPCYLVAEVVGAVTPGHMPTDLAIYMDDGTAAKSFRFGHQGNFTISGNFAGSNFSGSSSGANTGDETAAGILTKLLTVDGSGSGLDADTLDGHDSAYFATAGSLSGYQPLNGNLTTISGLSPSNDDILQRKAGAWTNRTMAQVKTDLVMVKGDVGLGNVDNTSDVNKPVSTAQAAADTAVLTAAEAYADALVVGLLDDRGNFDASANAFPSSGGSGAAGAIVKGDLWTISVAGTLGGHAVTAGDVVRALVNTPGSTDSNWAISENNFGYVAENTANKVTSMSGASTNTQYASAKATYDADVAVQVAAAADATSKANAAAAASQPLDGTLTALAASNWVANSLPIGTGADTLSQTAFAANTFPARASTGDLVAKTISDDALAFVAAANNGAMRSALGLGTLATQSGTFSGTSSGTNTGDQTTVSGNAGTATALQTARAIYGNNFDGTAALNQIIASAYGGTGNGFTKFSGPTTSERTFTLPDANATIATVAVDNAFTAGQTITPAANTSGLTVASHTHTTSNPAVKIAQTWNAGGVTFTGLFANFTDSASAAASLMLDLQIGSVSTFSIDKTGQASTPKNGAAAYQVLVSGQNIVGFGRNSSVNGFSIWGGSQASPSNTNADLNVLSNTVKMPSGSALGWASSNVTQNFDTTILRAAANSVQFGGNASAAGAATARTELNKAVTAIPNNSATAVLTITIPNAAHSAQVYVEVCGSLGAGGAVGANEASATNCYTITLTRTAGVNATATISAASGAAATAVAGAATVTCTAAMSAVSGGVSASNSFTVNVTIARSGGSSTNHTCLVYAKLMNANATGLTLS